MSLVSVDELEDYMSKVAFTPEQKATAATVLDGVQAQLERYINRPLEPTLIQERVQADESGFLQFSKTPITKLVSILDQYGLAIPISDGFESTPLAEDEYENYGATRQVDYVGGTFYTMGVPTYGGWGGGGADSWRGPRLMPGQWYVVKYVAKAADSVEDAKLGIMRVAAREMVRQHDDTLSLKDGMFRDDNNPEITGINGFGFTPDELTQYDRLRRRVIV